MKQALTSLALSLIMLGSAGAAELSRAEVAALAKPSTVLIEVSRRTYGTGFCIHSDGLFMTNAHVIASSRREGDISLIVDPGGKDQQTVKVTVVRLDKELDLALLKAEENPKVPALELGSDENLTELTEVIALGFPYGTALARKGEYPNVTVNVVNVSSLRTNEKRELHRIQVDSNLNPGNSGGPVLDRNGKVIGLVVGGIQGSGINLAIPVRHAQAFLDKPVMTFTAPKITAGNQASELEFRATAVNTLDPKAKIELEMTLTGADGEPRRFPMKLDETDYVAKAAPFPGKPKELRVNVTIEFNDGQLQASAADASLQIGDEALKLSDLARITLGELAEAERAGGEKVSGTLSKLDAIDVTLGNQTFKVKLADAKAIEIAPSIADAILDCTIVARKDGREIGRLHDKVLIDGAVRATLETLKAGNFYKPLKTKSTPTYLNVASSAGDYIGQGKSYSYKGDEMQVRASETGVTVNAGGWGLTIVAGRGGFLKVGEYDNAKRAPFNDNLPGISFSGNGRGCNTLAGKFVIWEFEIKDNVVTSFAIDFVQRCEGGGPPLFGMLRYNSSFE